MSSILFYYYHWVETPAGGLLVPEGIIRPVVSVSTLTWFIRYNFIEIYSSEIMFFFIYIY